MGVMALEIRQAIQNGNTTFEELSDVLMVGTGCNSCIPEVCEILKEEGYN
jgi:bacterioferritin-associated ferredoxin